MSNEEFDVTLPFGKEANKEATRNRKLDYWFRRLFTVMILSFVIATIILNLSVLMVSNTYVWFSILLLLNIGLCLFVVLIITTAKWL